MRRIGQVTAFYTFRDFMSNHHKPRNKFMVNGVWFSSMEQFIMYCKAMFFGDLEIAHQILTTDNCQEQKMLGRTVRNFVQKEWYARIEGWYLKGLIARYEYNPHDIKLLLATGTTILAEATRKDTIWACGLDEDDDDVQFEWKWRGSNLCGKGNQAARDYFNNKR